MLENIQRLCSETKVSIAKLERDLEFSRGSIYKWDKNSPSVEKLKKVADYFNVSTTRILYGFDVDKFSNLTNVARGERTLTQFSELTGVDHDEMVKICFGYKYDKPSLDTVKKIASNNQHDLIFSEDDFLEAAGYTSKKQLNSARNRLYQELVERYESQGFYVYNDEEGLDEIHISRATGAWHEAMSLDEFLEEGFDLLDDYVTKYVAELGVNAPETMAAHHDGEEWTAEELAEIERFKEFIKTKRHQEE